MASLPLALIAIVGARSLVAGPASLAGANSWQLDLRFHDPQRITLKLPGDSSPTTYWYVVYEVTNHTGRDVLFFPSFRLVTDTLEVVRSGMGVSPRVFDAIAARHRREFPFFTHPLKVSGLLPQGEENARSSAIVFRRFDEAASRFTIFLSGLSGEIDRVANPSFDANQPESNGNARFFLRRRALALHYDLPGDPTTRIDAQPIRRSREWVMR